MRTLTTVLQSLARQKKRAEAVSIALAFAVSIVSLWFSWTANRQAVIQARPYLALDYSKLRPQGDARIEVIVRRPGFIEIQREHNKERDNV